VNDICIIIPTLDKERGKDTGKLALLTARAETETRLIISHDYKGEGFTKTVNRGLRRTDPSEDVCILNDDIYRFNYSWLGALQRFLYTKEDYGLVAPTGDCASSTAKANMGTSGTKEVNMIPFWCALIKREVLDDVGGLDSDFIHYSSDTWFCREATAMGWKCLWARPVYLWHTHEGSGFRSKWREHDTIVYRRKMREHGFKYRN